MAKLLGIISFNYIRRGREFTRMKSQREYYWVDFLHVHFSYVLCVLYSVSYPLHFTTILILMMTKWSYVFCLCIQLHGLMWWKIQNTYLPICILSHQCLLMETECFEFSVLFYISTPDHWRRHHFSSFVTTSANSFHKYFRYLK